MRSWVRHRSFHTRLTALVTLAVGVAVALAATASYFAVSHQLNSQIDNSLRGDYNQLFNQTSGGPGSQISGSQMVSVLNNHGQGTTVAILDEGDALNYPGGQDNPNLKPVGAGLLKGKLDATERLRTTSTSGVHYRVLAVRGLLVQNPQNPNQAFFTIQAPAVATGTPAVLLLAQPLSMVNNTLAKLRLVLFLVAIGGILLALGLASFVAGATIRPVKRLTAAAEHVAETQQLDPVVHENSEDELGRLAGAFNKMLAAVGASRRQQAQLVSDAGHELRTPLTSLRTNVELLVRARDLPEDDRRELLSDVTAQFDEMTTLVGDLVELARQDEQQPEPTEIRLDNLVEHALERAKRRAPSLRFDVSLTAGSVRAQPPMLERAVLNVLDNAAKWSPPGSAVQVVLARSDRWVLTVRDHGPGIAEEDLNKVFDRFYRAPAARSMPGSGLGLAIVRQVVRAHGGVVHAERPADGGTLMRIELPIVTEQEPTDVPEEHLAADDQAVDWRGPITSPLPAPDPAEIARYPAVTVTPTLPPPPTVSPAQVAGESLEAGRPS